MAETNPTPRHTTTASTRAKTFRQVGAQVGRGLRAVLADNWKVVLYVLLIVLCVLFAPEAPLKFIYTEF